MQSTVSRNKTTIGSLIVKNWERMLALKPKNERNAKVFYSVMVVAATSILFATWLEPTRGPIGLMFRAHPGLLFVITQGLIASIYLFGLGMTGKALSGFEWIVANAPMIIICLTPAMHNLAYLLTTCNLDKPICPTVAWSSAIPFLLLGFLLVFLAVVIDLGIESEIIQENIGTLAIEYVKIDTNE